MADFGPDESGGGNTLTAAEEVTIQAIADGTYFVYNETPSGSINSSDGVTGNVTFTLAHTPNPASSLQLTLQGQLQIQGNEYILSGNTITFTAPPFAGMILKAVSYTVAP